MQTFSALHTSEHDVPAAHYVSVVDVSAESTQENPVFLVVLGCYSTDRAGLRSVTLIYRLMIDARFLTDIPKLLGADIVCPKVMQHTVSFSAPIGILSDAR
jgi:hypothetical protein